jgi:hypothetical protein
MKGFVGGIPIALLAVAAQAMEHTVSCEPKLYEHKADTRTRTTVFRAMVFGLTGVVLPWVVPLALIRTVASPL